MSRVEFHLVTTLVHYQLTTKQNFCVLLYRQLIGFVLCQYLCIICELCTVYDLVGVCLSPRYVCVRTAKDYCTVDLVILFSTTGALITSDVLNKT